MLVHDFLNYFAREQADTPCVVLDDRVLSYSQVQSRSNQLANAMLAAGLDKGDRFAFLARNSIETVIAYLAGSIAGIVPVPLNWRLAPPEWQYIIQDAGARWLIAESRFCADADIVRNELANIDQCVSFGDAAPHGWQDLEQLCDGCSTIAPDSQIDDRDVFYQMYTSGTTGRPKGALLTHHAVIANSHQTLPLFRNVMGPGQRALIVMPMFHAGATSFVIGSLASGSTMVIHREFSAERVAEALSNQHINVVNLVPAMIQAMLMNVEDIADRDFSFLQVMIYGASSIAVDTLQRAIEVFDCEFFQGFGQTESSATMTFLTADDHRRALEGKPELLLSAGRAILGTTVRIVDSDDEELPTGESGEIVMRGPQVMKSYWNMPEASATALRNGWLHSGDIGKLDEDGYLYIHDRLKDMVVSGGENVYPREVENLLFEHPAIADAAVIGLPDEQYGEAVTAVVVLRQGTKLATEELIDYCRGKLGGFKIPRRVEFINELPRNPSGKVLKNVLRDTYQAR